ncbi:hypothetical protein G9A89_003074 [Geosiphon pyriformis]|nr:hypothetical protein G9A89_003074 [Geosiphon pyriformis]
MSYPSKRMRTSSDKNTKNSKTATHSFNEFLQDATTNSQEAFLEEEVQHELSTPSSESSHTESTSDDFPSSKRPKNELTTPEDENDNTNTLEDENDNTNPIDVNNSTLQKSTIINTDNLSPQSPLFSPQYAYTINSPPVGRSIRIYCDGIYDLFHFGHARMLEQAKKAFDDVYLIVGVCDDQTTHAKKGKTVLNENERFESLRHCKWVDEVIAHAPWVIDQEFLDCHQIDYVAHDDIPYASIDSSDVYAFVKEQGKFLPTQRTDGVSTSDLITRIVRDYDQYVRRNLERGVTAKELNLGFLREQEINVKRSISDIRSSIHQNWQGTKTELRNDLSELKNDLRQTFAVWEERSQEFVRGFSGMFGAESVVDKLFRRRSQRSLRGIGNAEDSTINNEINTSDGNPIGRVHRSKSLEFFRRGSS